MTVLHSPRSALARVFVTVIVATAVPLLLGAADRLQEAISRLQAMSPGKRTEIAESLRRFDLQISSEEQKTIRQVDEQINKLPPKTRFATWARSDGITTG